MKTSINITDSLFERTRELAASERTTIRALVEEGLRKVIADHTQPQPFKLKDGSFKGGQGLQPGVDLSNWEQIRSMIYEGHGG